MDSNDGKIVIENVNVPGSTTRVSKAINFIGARAVRAVFREQPRSTAQPKQST